MCPIFVKCPPYIWNSISLCSLLDLLGNQSENLFQIIICSVRLHSAPLNQQLTRSVYFRSPPSTHTGDKRTIAHLHRMSAQNVFNHEKMCTKCIAVCAKVHMLVKVNVYSCENVHRCVHIGKCPQLCTLRGTVPRYICHRVSIRANFRIFPPTNCDLLSCGRLDLSPAGAVFVQSSQVICPPA